MINNTNNLIYGKLKIKKFIYLQNNTLKKIIYTHYNYFNYLSMSEDNKKIPTEKVFQLYGDQDISMLMNISNVTDLDRKIIFNDIVQDKNIFTVFKFREIEKRLRVFMDEIRGNSLKPHILFANIKGAEEENLVHSNSSFQYNKMYLSPLVFPYLYKSNTFYVKGNYALYNNRFNKNKTGVIKEDEVSAAVEYSQKFSKFSYIFSNLTFMNVKDNLLELETKFKSSKSERDVKRLQTSSAFKINLSKNFNERPFIFRENFSFDKINKLNFQYAHKIIKNYVDEFNCSSELISKLPQEDSQHNFKLFYLYNISNLANHNFAYFKVGSTLVNSLNSNYLKNKLSLRKFFFTEPFVYQMNLELGNVTNLKAPNEQLRIHERFFVPNFRGIKNPSRKIVLEEGKFFIYLKNIFYKKKF
jgi:hypothetical protein